MSCLPDQPGGYDVIKIIDLEEIKGYISQKEVG